jgi:hypothetical protein
VTTQIAGYFQAFEICSVLHRCGKSLDRMVKRKQFPAPVEGTGGSPGRVRLWRAEDVMEYVEKLKEAK